MNEDDLTALFERLDTLISQQGKMLRALETITTRLDEIWSETSSIASEAGRISDNTRRK